MRRIYPVIAAASIVAAGCTDRLTTLTDPDQFPEDLVPTTIEFILDASIFLSAADVYSAGTTAADFGGLVVAREFDGVLFSNVLSRFAVFPDSISVAGAWDKTFQYEDSRVVVTVPNDSASSESVLTFYLWTIAQPWDSTAVSWDFAVDRPDNRVPWTEPGGTRGELVDAVSWSQADTSTVADSLFFNVPRDIVRRLASDEIFGLMLTLEVESARIDVGPMVMEASIRPTATPDTTITRTIGGGPEVFVMTPEPDLPDDVLRVGGVTSDRSVISINLPATLPKCDLGPFCGTIALEDVSLNLVDLLFDPLPATSGYRPITTFGLQGRRVLEPELGERAPLGSLFTGGNGVPIPAEEFVNPGGPVSMLLTGLVLQAIANDTTSFASRPEDQVLSIALVSEPEASRLDYAWFSRSPRLRFIYTLPTVPSLP